MRGPRGALVHRLVAERAARAVRRRGAGGGVAPPHGARQRGRRRGDERGRRRLGRPRRRRRDAGPGPHRRPARRAGDGQGARLPAPPAADPGEPPAGAHRRQLRARRRGAVRLSGGQRRAHAARRRRGGRARTASPPGPWTTRPARPSTRAPGCWGSGTRAARSWTSWRRAATRASSAFRAPCPAAATSASAASRRRCSTTSGAATRRRSRRTAPTSPPRTRRRSSASWSRRRWPAPPPRACARVAVAGGVAANSGLRRALTERCEAEGLQLSLPPLSLCTDNAGMIGLAAGFLPALAWPDYLALDAFASDAEARARAGRGRAPPAAPAPRRQPGSWPPAASTSCLSEQVGLGRTAARAAASGARLGPVWVTGQTPSFPPAAADDAPRMAAELFVECLESEGVEYVFGIPGEETLDLSEALDRSQLHHLRAHPPRAGRRLHGRRLRPSHRQARRLPRHARAPAPPTWPPASATPPSTTRRSWRSPARPTSPACTRRRHQFIDTVEMLRPMTKWNTRLHHPRMIREAVRKAFSIAAAEKPGATHLELPEDVMATAVVGRAAAARPRAHRRGRPREPAARRRDHPGGEAAGACSSATASCGSRRPRPCAPSANRPGCT